MIYTFGLECVPDGVAAIGAERRDTILESLCLECTDIGNTRPAVVNLGPTRFLTGTGIGYLLALCNFRNEFCILAVDLLEAAWQIFDSRPSHSIEWCPVDIFVVPLWRDGLPRRPHVVCCRYLHMLSDRSLMNN